MVKDEINGDRIRIHYSLGFDFALTDEKFIATILTEGLVVNKLRNTALAPQTAYSVSIPYIAPTVEATAAIESAGQTTEVVMLAFLGANILLSIILGDGL